MPPGYDIVWWVAAEQPELIGAASTLASVLTRLGEHEAARDLNQDTLARRRRILGEDHPHTLESAETSPPACARWVMFQMTPEYEQATPARTATRAAREGAPPPEGQRHGT
jgi:hypothetical protein